MYGRTRRRSGFNPFISLTDILFNLILVLIFASALFAQDINRKYAENRDFQRRLAALQVERDELMAGMERLGNQLDAAQMREDLLRRNNLSLEEQIAGLIGNLDLAQARQEQLAQQISLLVGRLDTAQLEKEGLETKLTVVLGELELAEDQRALLEEEVTVLLGDLTQAQLVAGSLREQVSLLSRNNFLVVELEWLTQAHDLDLHVTDPDGKRFFWNQPTYAGESSRLTLDNRLGARPNRPGLEIWTARELKLGTYRIEVGLWGCDRASESDGYRPCSADGSATVLVRHRDGDDVIRDIQLPAGQTYAQVGANGREFTLNPGLFGRLVTVALVEVYEDEGEVNVRIEPAPDVTLTRLAGRPD